MNFIYGWGKEYSAPAYAASGGTLMQVTELFTS